MPDCVRVRLTGPTTKASHTTAWQFNKKITVFYRVFSGSVIIREFDQSEHKKFVSTPRPQGGTDIELEHFSLSSKCDQHVLTCSHCSSINTLRAISTSSSCLRRGDSPEHVRRRPCAQVRWRWRVSEVWYCRLDPHNPTIWYLISRCSAGRSVILCTAGRSVTDPRARRSLMKGRKPGDCQQDNRGIKFQLTHPGAPLRRKPSIYWSGEKRDGSCLNESECRREDETESPRKNKHRATADEPARTQRQISRPHPAGRYN
ncbi:hypothetical protein T01_4746 [Trichinella spiralis]|uniref:Uncharacterized protein n=1 Tax=Trichinella spiralis TaxID=6334 RepID=A0A0V1B1K4_TRISP|nr:hypothetical protein T01_4746 [Trichinella spiralis]